MSRIGRKPIPLPAAVEVTIDGSTVRVRGPRGELARTFPPQVEIRREDGQLVVARRGEDRRSKAMHGLSRALLANMVEGVTQGYKKVLEIVGVGYRAEAKPHGLTLSLGFSHPVEYRAPEGITLRTPTPTVIEVEGIDKEKVGQVAAEIRSLRPPEPYKGKGIRYQGEQIRRKAGKAKGR